MLELALLLSLSAQQEAEVSDLLDLLDTVDPATRAQIEGAIERGEDLEDLPAVIGDVALEPWTRDGAIALVARFGYGRWSDPPAEETAVLIGLQLELDQLLLAPEAYGDPPEEQRRFERCLELLREEGLSALAARARWEQLDALGCGGVP
jgi:hypothetical protein